VAGRRRLPSSGAALEPGLVEVIPSHGSRDARVSKTRIRWRDASVRRG
jgi:hypothetical protein